MADESALRQIAYNEGAVLQLAGTHGMPAARAYAHNVADGVFNALIRIEGAEAAAAFAFALSDRVAGGLRVPTDWRAAAREAAPLPEPASVTPVTAAPSVPSHVAPEVLRGAAGLVGIAFAGGLVTGVVAGCVIAAMVLR
jgi:hypothetical protein